MRLLIYIIFVGTFLSCADAKETNEATIINRTTRKSADTLRNGSFPIFDEPSTDATAQQFAFKVNEIDAYAMRSNKIDTKITIDGVSNTPVTIWYDKKNRPIKIEYGVTDDSGDFTGVFKMYFINGDLWCADWLFAKYVFDEDHHLRY